MAYAAGSCPGIFFCDGWGRYGLRVAGYGGRKPEIEESTMSLLFKKKTLTGLSKTCG